ncbi:reverse transcriptase domain-containing protein, partial [Tanacetum coccineum]
MLVHYVEVLITTRVGALRDDLGELVCQDLGVKFASFIQCDVTIESDIENVINTTIAKHGKLDIMVNNAGIIDEPKLSILDNDKSDFEHVLKACCGGTSKSLQLFGADHVGYTDRFHELAKLVPHLVTPEAKRVTRYINRFPSQIRGMLRATQPVILFAGILTDEAVRSGTLAKACEKRKERDEASKSESVGKDKKKAKGG